MTSRTCHLAVIWGVKIGVQSISLKKPECLAKTVFLTNGDFLVRYCIGDASSYIRNNLNTFKSLKVSISSYLCVPPWDRFFATDMKIAWIIRITLHPISIR